MTTYRLRASALCIADNHLLALKHSDPTVGDFWGIPGGEIEPGESPLEAALRETREESGYITELLYDPQLVTEYDFVWHKHSYRCRTHWFVVQPVSDARHTPRAGDVEFITELRWIPLREWSVLFAGHVEIQQALARILAELQASGRATLS